jgi:6-phosphogluconolactonase
MNRTLALLASLAAFAGTAVHAAAAAAGSSFVYFGTYTASNTGSQGIYVATFDPASGRLGEPKLAAASDNPSFLAVHPKKPYLYAVNEVSTFEGQPAGAVSAFAIDPVTGSLRLLNQASSRGTGPCHVSVSRDGKTVFVANYGGGSVAAYPVRSDGGLGPSTGFVQHQGSSVDPRRQKGPHAHMIDTDPKKGNRVLAADLGLDRVLIYRLVDGQLAPDSPAAVGVDAGAGPRHFAFPSDGKDLYVFNEMMVTITHFRRDAEDFHRKDSVSTLPSGVSPGPQDSGAEIVAHPSGRFVYASNRGADQIAVFARTPTDGSLTRVEHVPSGGKTPRSFGIDPSGRWLIAANQRSETAQVVVFAIDLTTGQLKPTGQTVNVAAPVSVAFFPPKR